MAPPRVVKQLELTFVHNHECPRHGEEVVVHPETIEGVTYLPRVVCRETMMELHRKDLRYI